MRHRLSEMIKAKAENMDLVIIVKNRQNDGAWWALKSDKEILPSFSNGEYFACLPQHEEVCLHWLNGGDIQVLDSNWINVHPVESYPWESEHDFMCEDSKIRIKPRKEKRLIAINPKTSEVFVATSAYIADHGFQLIEIEVEV